MRGETDRECRAKGGKIKPYNAKGSNVVKEFHGAHPKMAPDATLKRGGGPIFRKRGGKVHEAAMELEERENHADGGAAGGGTAAAAGFKRGGAIEGKGKKPHMGRAGRARGGGVGSDLKPLTSADKPSKPKGRHIMSEGEKTP